MLHSNRYILIYLDKKSDNLISYVTRSLVSCCIYLQLFGSNTPNLTNGLSPQFTNVDTSLMQTLQGWIQRGGGGGGKT